MEIYTDDIARLVKDQAREVSKFRALAQEQEQELYVFAQSHARIAKERAMRRRQLKWLWARLKQVQAMKLTREELLMKLGWSMLKWCRAAQASGTRSIAKAAPGAATRRAPPAAHQFARTPAG